MINNTNYIGPYLAGLLEGDGHIVFQNKNKLNGKISYPYLAFTFSNKNLPLVNKFLDKFGGRIRFKNEENAIVWTINKHKELVNLVNLINGYFRTPKISKFNSLIEWLNYNYNYSININPVDQSELNCNGWLTGFLDADGHFKIRYTEKRIDELTKKVLTKARIEVRFVLEQRKVYPYNNESYKPIMEKIQSFFEIKRELRSSIHNIDKSYWIIEVTSLNKLSFLVKYLNSYPLLTCKQNDFEDWLKVYYFMLENKHLTDEGKTLIKQIKLNMNRKRKNFNWDHLNYLNKIL